MNSPQKDRQTSIAIFVLLLCLSVSFSTAAQSTPAVTQKKDSPQEVLDNAAINAAKKETLDTEESLKYVGNRLLFQLRKRLHLTTEEDKASEKGEKKKKVKLSIFGIEVEKS